MPRRALGIDGYRNGWICVWLDETGACGFEAVSHISEIKKFNASIAMIDIPIGLPPSGYRACDLAARELLNSGRSRVFLGVRRFLLEHLADYSAANSAAKRDGKGISRQLFCILPKIAEVDAELTKSGWKQDYLRESHPELVFYRLNNNRLMESKKTKPGEAARIRLIEENGIPDIQRWKSDLPRKGKLDDLLDASACALAARNALVERGLRVGGVDRDETDLRMEIWY